MDEQNFEDMPLITTPRSDDQPLYIKLALPIAILLAGVMISGTLLYTRNSNKLAQIGDPTAGKPDNQVVNIKITDQDHILGNSKAKVTMVEYADFRCPFCERFYQQTATQLIKDYVNTGKVKFIFRHYAFLGQQSVWAAQASECAAEQGKFWQYHDWLYSNQALEANLAYYSKANLISYASKVGGIDAGQFANCLNSDKYSDRVNADLASGQAAGVDGTPTTFINGQRLVGAQPYETFKAAIEAALK